MPPHLLVLKIDALHERHTGLMPSQADTYTETACVCFARYHSAPVMVQLRQSEQATHRLVCFTQPDERMKRAYANEIDTTEAGAYCVALASAEEALGMVAVRRAETQTGSDWYIAPPGTDPEDLEHCIRLEVSGVGAGSPGAVAERLRQKIEQTIRGQSNLPAVAIVVGFKSRLVAVSPLGVDR